MQVRCYRCGTSFELSRAAMEEAVGQADKLHHKSYVVECIKCRQAIKVPLDQIRRQLPRTSPGAPAASETTKTPENPETHT